MLGEGKSNPRCREVKPPVREHRLYGQGAKRFLDFPPPEKKTWKDGIICAMKGKVE